MNDIQKTIYIICGPTAVGKTSFAIKLAKHLQTQIISADSRQCYREMDIGVAKPSAEELNAVHHYFINSHSIAENVNAAVFEQYALQCTEKIFETNDHAVMVGGTGLYIKAFCDGLDNIPEVDEKIRQHIIDDYKSNGLEYLQLQVQQKDPAFWQVAEQENPQRLMRALEVFEITGKSITTFRTGKKAERPFQIKKIGLELPREQLYAQINNRVDQMMEHGLLEEVRGLMEYRNLNALQTVGYSEIFDFLDGTMTLPQAVEKIKINTRHYAKRQMTWFKKDDSIQWIIPGHDNFEELK